MHIAGAEKYELKHKYRGMRPLDEIIWDEFVHRHRGEFEMVWYNVHIGDPARDDDERRMMKDNGAYDVSCWCVDVLAKSGDQFYVIEIKPDARAGALGQALAYKAILEAEGKIPPGSVPVVLTDNLHPITEQAAQLLGVQILVP